MNLLPFQQFLILFSSSWLLEHVCCDCIADSESEKETLKVLEPLKDIITVKDDKGNYSYRIGFCVDVNGYDAGVEQTGPDGTTHIVGRITQTDIKQGTNWIILTYKDGEAYRTHCGEESRQAHIVISCNQDSVEPKHARVIEENTNKSGDCYYLFEVESRIACSRQKSSSISIGWLLIIIVLVVAATYLVVGFLYQRFVQQAKGREQIPNLEFWTKFGNLAADGCDFMCRCKRTEEARSYKGLGDDQLGMDEDEERDENILPM